MCNPATSNSLNVFGKSSSCFHVREENYTTCTWPDSTRWQYPKLSVCSVWGDPGPAGLSRAGAQVLNNLWLFWDLKCPAPCSTRSCCLLGVTASSVHSDPFLASSPWVFRVGIAPGVDVELKSVVKYGERQSQNLLLPLIKAVEGKGLINNFQKQKFIPYLARTYIYFTFNLYLIWDGNYIFIRVF